MVKSKINNIVSEMGIDFYNSIFVKKSKRYFKRYEKLYNRATELVQSKGTILELGCGTGVFAGNYLSKKTQDFLAIDFSNVGIGIAKTNYPHLANKFKCQDIRKMNLKDWKSGNVIMLELLEHIDEDKEILKNLCSGIKVIFSVPYNEKVNSKGYPMGWPTHRRSYSEIVLRERYGNLICLELIEKIEHWFLVLGRRL